MKTRFAAGFRGQLPGEHLALVIRDRRTIQRSRDAIPLRYRDSGTAHVGCQDSQDTCKRIVELLSTAHIQLTLDLGITAIPFSSISGVM
jgi:hypothetical protein